MRQTTAPSESGESLASPRRATSGNPPSSPDNPHAPPSPSLTPASLSPRRVICCGPLHSLTSPHLANLFIVTLKELPRNPFHALTRSHTTRPVFPRLAPSSSSSIPPVVNPEDDAGSNEALVHCWVRERAGVASPSRTRMTVHLHDDDGVSWTGWDEGDEGGMHLLYSTRTAVGTWSFSMNLGLRSNALRLDGECQDDQTTPRNIRC